MINNNYMNISKAKSQGAYAIDKKILTTSVGKYNVLH